MTGAALPSLLLLMLSPACLGVASISIWPLPRSIESLGNATVVVDAKNFRFNLPSDASPVLQSAENRFRSLFFPRGVDLVRERAKSTAMIAGINFHVEDQAADLTLGVDESYSLTVNAPAVELTAKTVWGALHGLQTLAQMMSFDITTKTYNIAGAPWQVEDAPRFQHRGVLIDSGRHFEPTPVVKAFIDTLPHAKLNVLHWHLTEDQSFPIESRIYPELSEKGAWSPQEQYAWQEIVDVVDYARERGVRVIPEFDMPGHSSSWRNSHPEFFATGCLDKGSRGAFDPANNATFAFLEKVLKDWTDGIFTDAYLHLGSDEVPSGCWNNTKDLAFMKQKNISDFNSLFEYFVARMVGIAKGLGKSTILWDESFISGRPPKDAIIQNWHDADLTKQIVEAGYRAIYSPDGAGWYLDGLANSWEKMYNLDPMFNISSSYEKQVLGGEGCMWGETVDPSELQFTVWPRMAAIAERLWSPRAVNSTELAEPRLHAFRCWLLARGVNAGTVGSNGRTAPPGPGSCLQAGSATAMPTKMVEYEEDGAKTVLV